MKQHYNNQKINNEELSAYSQTINSLAFNIGFVNESYFAFMYNKKQLSQLLDMNYKNIEEFYDKVSKYYYDDLTTALNRMAKKGWIIFNEVYMGDFITDEHKIIVQSNDDFGDKKNEVKLDYITETKPLSAKELQIYKNLNSQAFLHFGCSDYSEYIKKYNSSIPLQKYRNSLIIQELNCTSVYKIYQIAALPEHLELCQNTLSKQLNSNFLNRIIKNKQSLVANQIKEKEDYYDTYPIYNENNKLKIIDSIKQSLNDFKILAKCLVSNDKKDLDRFETLTKYFNRKINFQHEQNNRAVKALQGLSKQEVDDILSNQSIIINDDFI